MGNKLISDITETQSTFNGTDYYETQDSTTSKKILGTTIQNGITPPGVIFMYGSTTPPSGWLNCDGSTYSKTTYAALYAIISTTFGGNSTSDFKVPDFRGIFPRGVGTSTTLFNANGIGFTGVLSSYNNDKMQGHYHDYYVLPGYDTGGGVTIDRISANATGISTCNDRIRAAKTDGVNGTPRTGTETNPANLGINFIIKY